MSAALPVETSDRGDDQRQLWVALGLCLAPVLLSGGLRSTLHGRFLVLPRSQGPSTLQSRQVGVPLGRRRPAPKKCFEGGHRRANKGDAQLDTGSRQAVQRACTACQAVRALSRSSEKLATGPPSSPEPRAAATQASCRAQPSLVSGHLLQGLLCWSGVRAAATSGRKGGRSTPAHKAPAFVHIRLHCLPHIRRSRYQWRGVAVCDEVRERKFVVCCGELRRLRRPG